MWTESRVEQSLQCKKHELRSEFACQSQAARQTAQGGAGRPRRTASRQNAKRFAPPPRSAAGSQDGLPRLLRLTDCKKISGARDIVYDLVRPIANEAREAKPKSAMAAVDGALRELAANDLPDEGGVAPHVRR